ncbi:hypothetical protein INR49_006810, partial [Caranx melampygus]
GYCRDKRTDGGRGDYRRVCCSLLHQETHHPEAGGGRKCLLECQVGGNPKPHIIWKKSGVPLTTGYRYKVTYKKETGECRLEISMTFADDAGEYSIFIKNPHGEASASASLLEEEEYEAYMKQHDVTYKAEVTTT